MMISAFATVAGASHTGGARLRLPVADTTVTIDPTTRRAIGGITTLDRLKWFNGHWAPDGPGDWRPEDLVEFGAAADRAHPGRSFVRIRPSQQLRRAHPKTRISAMCM